MLTVHEAAPCQRELSAWLGRLRGRRSYRLRQEDYPQGALFAEWLGSKGTGRDQSQVLGLWLDLCATAVSTIWQNI
jgi:hypothetical protein